MLAIAILPFCNIMADDSIPSKFKSSPLSISLELTTKYMWRAIEYGDAPTSFAIINFEQKGFSAYAEGVYAFNSSHSEVDLGAAYNYKWLTVGVNDYYYPSSVGEKDHYFKLSSRKNGRYMMYRDNYTDEPSHDDYCQAAAKLLRLSPEQKKAFQYNYMNTPVCFHRENVKELLARIANNDVLHSWKHALCNTYRFSEYYTYAIFTEEFLNMRNHFITGEHTLPQIDVSEVSNVEQFTSQLEKCLKAPTALGLWLQKKSRKSLTDSYLPFDEIYKCVHNYWNR